MSFCATFPHPRSDTPADESLAMWAEDARGAGAWLGPDGEYVGVVMPRNPRGSVLTFYCHGMKNSGDDQHEAGVRYMVHNSPWYAMWAAAAATRGPVVSATFGGGFTWGGPAMERSLDRWHAWAVREWGVRADRINLMGQSMGGLNSLVYAVKRADKIGAIWIEIPALDPIDFYAYNRATEVTTELRGDMRAAHSTSGNAATSFDEMIDSFYNDDRLPWHTAKGLHVADYMVGHSTQDADVYPTGGFAPKLAAARIPLVVAYSPNDPACVPSVQANFATAYMGRPIARTAAAPGDQNALAVDGEYKTLVSTSTNDTGASLGIYNTRPGSIAICGGGGPFGAVLQGHSAYGDGRYEQGLLFEHVYDFLDQHTPKP